MTVFVTGANGFIGRSLVRKLAGGGDRVLCLVRRPEEAAWMRDVPGLEPVQGDLRHPSGFKEPLAEAEVVFHLAGLTKALNRREYLEVNGDATGELARLCSRSGRTRRFVYVSSLAVAGPRTASSPAREEDLPEPITPYGESKLRGETLLADTSVPWTIIRPPVVYGPYDRDVFLYFKAAARGIVPLIRGGRLQLSIAHVDDVVAALTLAAASERAIGKIYYVSDGGVHTTRDLAHHLLAIVGRGRLLHAPDALLKVAGLWGDLLCALTRKPAVLNRHKVLESCQPGWVCSIERIQQDLGYVPGVDLAPGLTSTFRWYEQNGWI